MIVISERNVNDALVTGLRMLDSHGVDRPSRNGLVRVFKEPVTTCYQNPRERVLFNKTRDANPYFHFMESLWMIAGRNDVEWISRFSSNIANYSDNGVTFHGAYGHRWRNWFHPAEGDLQYGDTVLDQLETIATILKQDKYDRRAVLQMWDANADLGMDGKDFPCNTMATFRINPDGDLDMSVFNRSNDMIWGAYGANAVHFSVLQEVMAAWIGVPVGRYWQISTNFHAYHSTLEKNKPIAQESLREDYYGSHVFPYQIVNGSIDDWFADLNMFMEEGPVIGYRDRFFKKVAIPMLISWYAWKNKDNPNNVVEAIKHADNIAAHDWRIACTQWLERRL